jgi:hypothetical protein
MDRKSKKNQGLKLKLKENEIEKYFKTENEHWNGYAFSLLCEELMKCEFDNPEIPLKIFEDSICIICDNVEHPLKAVQLCNEIMENNKINTRQKYFVYNWIYKYMENSEFEFDAEPVIKLLNIQKEKYKVLSEPVKPITKDIRESLKKLIQNEIVTLPLTLKNLEPVQRLNIICKLIPFVLPKIESIDHDHGEPGHSVFEW